RLDFADAGLDVADEIDPAGGKPCGEGARARTEGREMELDRIARVVEFELRIEEADFAPLAFHVEIDGFAAQQPVDLADVGFHRLDLDRAEPHGAARSEPGADAEIDAAWRELVDARERVG